MLAQKAIFIIIGFFQEVKTPLVSNNSFLLHLVLWNQDTVF